MTSWKRTAAWRGLVSGVCLWLLPLSVPATTQQPATNPAAAAISPDEVVLTVGDTKITAAEFERILSALPPQYQATLAASGKKNFAQQLAEMMGLAMEAEKRQLDKSPAFEQMMEFERRVLLAQLTMSELAAQSGTVSAEEVSYYYQTHQQDFEQVRLRGIYIPYAPPPSGPQGAVQTLSAKPAYTEQQAQRKALELRARIQSGQDMAALARAESQHPTAAKGGEFGFLTRNQTRLAGGIELPPAIATAVFTLQLRQVSAPLKDRSGFYLFRVEEKRVQPLEEVQQAIQAALSQQKMMRRLETVREHYPVTLHPGYFADPPAMPAPASGPRQ